MFFYLFGAAPFLECVEMKKGARSLIYENQQQRASFFVGNLGIKKAPFWKDLISKRALGVYSFVKCCERGVRIYAVIKVMLKYL